MTDRSPQAPQQRQPYGVVRAGPGEVVLDVTDAALTRLVGLLIQRPSLLAVLAQASNPGTSAQQAAIPLLLNHAAVRAACTVHLSVEDAVELASEIIAAATPDHSPGRARTSVSGHDKNETTDRKRKGTR